MTGSSCLLLAGHLHQYAIGGDTYGQLTLDCQCTEYAKAAHKPFLNGTRTNHGYTVKGQVITKKCPVIGDVIITERPNPAMEAQAAGGLFTIGGDITFPECSKPLVDGQDSRSFFAISGDTGCQSDLDCK